MPTPVPSLPRAARIAATVALFLPAQALAGAPIVTPLLQFHGNDVWSMVGNIVSLKTGVAGTASGTSSANLLSPPATRGGAWTNTTLHSFPSFTNDGAYPGAGVATSAGLLFGSTSGGGNPACADGCGTIFQLTPPASPGAPWTETQLAVFNPDNNGYGPDDTVALENKNTLFGTAIHAANDTTRPGGTTPVGGVVFQLVRPAGGTGPWTETVLHHFDAGSQDGDTPFGGLIIGPGHVLYGTTFTGGACNQGTVYSVTPPAKKGGAWAETRLHDFGATSGSCDYDDGELPVAALTRVGATLYGTTREGGAGGCGTAFTITLGATPTYQLLYTFGQTSTDACSPQAPVRVGSTGTIYGTTLAGGAGPVSTECPYGCGTLFTLTPQSGGTYTEAVQYSFTGGLDGSEPRTNLLGVPGKPLKGATSHGGFATDTSEPDYASYGVFYQFTPGK